MESSSIIAAKQNLKVQLYITALSIFLFIAKITAFFFTNSLAILTDALESIVNVVAGFIGVYSLYVVTKPRDKEHPYGHGKAEFVSAAAEGTLIIAAGCLIIYQTIHNLLAKKAIESLDTGLILVGITGLINFAAGYYCLVVGKKNKSMALQASGKHLQIDTYTTFAIIAALVVILYTKWFWLDAVVAFAVSLLILYNGYTIIRTSLAGIMDEADIVLLEQLVVVLNNNRKENWIDLHNLRVIKYGSTLHVDCHLTVPWFLNVHEAHKEIDSLAVLIKREFDNALELFVHTDGCLDFSCAICTKKGCTVRVQPFKEKIVWSLDNIIRNQKHGADII